jgi:hypothetical protein
VVSNLDKSATLLGLVGEELLSAETVDRVRGIEQRGAFVHLLFKLSALPRVGAPF